MKTSALEAARQPYLGQSTSGSHRFGDLASAAFVALGALLMLALVAILPWQVASEGRRVEGFSSELIESINTLSATRQVLISLQAAETGERGYLLTGAIAFLEPFNEALKSLPQEFEVLVEKNQDGPFHADALRIVSLGYKELYFLQEILQLREEAGVQVAIERVAEQQAKKTMDELRVAIEQLRSAQAQIIQANAVALEEQSRWFSQLATLLAAIIAFSILCGGCFGLRYIFVRSRVERESLAARDKAQRESMAKSDFLSSMSHEMRTPLNGVIGYTDLLLEHDLTSEQRRLAKRVQTSGKALLKVISDVLDISRIEAGEVGIELRPMTIQGLLETVSEILATFAGDKGISLRLTCSEDLPASVIGDEARLRQVLLNLVNNAIEFTEAGSVTVSATLASRPGWVRFAVSDTGVGIDKEHLTRLFDRYFQVNSGRARRLGGTGLGLAISQELVRLMGGEITVESELGMGSTFSFEVSLPRADASEALEVETTASAQSASVLLVEDVKSNRELAVTFLKSAGFSVDVAQDGAEAVAMAAVQKYDIIFMDIQMPVMDGLAACRILRDRGDETPIVTMTANVLSSEIRNFTDAGMNGRVGKPFNRQDLVSAVKTYVKAGAASPSGEAAQGPGAVSAFSDARRLMGDDWSIKALEGLKQRIEIAFPKDAMEDASEATLGREAHRVTSHAGILGFSELASACSALERACNAHSDVAAAYAVARRSARTVSAEIDRVLQGGFDEAGPSAPRHRGSVLG